VQVSPEHPILIDKFLEDAFEYDVDAISDGVDVVIGGVMEHIEEAGIHSGDSACVLPPYMVKPVHIDTMRTYTIALARALRVVGLINVQYAIKNDVVYVLEVNPRASRTIPFVSKAIGVPLARLAARVMAGRTLRELGFTQEIIPTYASVKEVVLPFVKFAGTDSLLGPEMKSTGEVMGIAGQPGMAFAKSQSAAGGSLPRSGSVLISVNEYDHRNVVGVARELADLGFSLIATDGTRKTLMEAGLPVTGVNKVYEGTPHVVDYIKQKRIHLIINTPLGKHARKDDYAIRRAAIEQNVPCITTLSAAWAAVKAIRALREEPLSVRSIQEWHQELKV
jgi:carbamoyl-phosphate synthase large subunit